MSSAADGPSPKALPARPAATSVATAPRPGPPGVPTPPLHGPWPRPSGSGERWPGPARPATTATSVALLVAALVAALSIPLDRAGVGWLVTAVAGTIALIVARMVPYRPPASLPPPLVWRGGPTLTADRFGWSAATVALLGVGTVRAAGWLFLLCLATALVTGALAVAGGRSLRAMALAAGIAPIAGFRSLPWVTRGFGRVKKGPRVVATIAVSVALLAVFGALFASADRAFADVIAKLVPSVDAGTVTRWIFVFVVAGVVLGGAAYLRAAPPDLSGMDGPGRRRVARLEWAIPLALLVLLFAAFVAVQLAVLFGGSRHVLETDGLTYADYARSGFWQLLVVTGLTLAVVAGAVRWAPRDTRTDRVLIRVVLGALATLTLVIVASALHRMNVYADTYGLTRLRLLVALCELWLGVVFLLVLIAGVRVRAPWLARAVAGAGVLALLGLAAANPDGLIADRNIARYERTQNIDTTYLANLSADAVPALDRLGPDHRDCALNPISTDLSRTPDDWRGWNYGRSHARALLTRNPAPEQPGCDFYR
jgi:Domain of unknown function (DUF4173)